jgi:citrate lyase beta subunit
MLDPIELGASLYVPANHPDLCEIAAGQKLLALRSLIFCTEDALADHELPGALAQLARALPELVKADPNRHFFVRVRNPEGIQWLRQQPGAEALKGVVLPKVHAGNLPSYLKELKDSHWLFMPTLETREVFNDKAMHALVHLLDKHGLQTRIPCLRIGGNDLLALLRCRRPKGRTIYDTPIGHVIARLATTFIPSGYSLSAPVFERLDDFETLGREIQKDLDHGLVGKTAIHPHQVSFIEQHYRVNAQDVDIAMEILASDAPGVFQRGGGMCEPATHRPWARSVLEAARLYGFPAT